MTDGTAPPAAAQAPAGRDGMAWALAALPLATAALLAALVLLDIADDMRALTALTLFVTAAFVLADRQRLRRFGVAAGGMPSAWWSLLPPVYLWRRAAALGGSRAPFWAWFASTAAASAVRVAVLAVLASQVAEERAAAGRLPDCASRDMVADVKAVFDSLSVARQAGVRAVSLGSQREVAQGPGSTPTERYCTGVMLASDTVEYEISYSFERRQDEVIIRLQLETDR
jgi:hypothetical protein